MDQLSYRAKPDFRWLTNLAGGFLLFLCLVLGTAVFLFKPFQPIPETSTPVAQTNVPKPHILVHQPVDKSAILYEDFSSNKREWSIYYPYGKLELINGKLILQSNIEERYLIGNSQEFDLIEGPYYVQADFTTDVAEVFSYGLIFGFNESLGTYYMFDLWPTTGHYQLLKYNTGKLDQLIPFAETTVNSYPEVNTLSVYVDEGDIELYINGDLVSRFTDKTYFTSAGVGVFVNNTGYRLIVDDFFAYAEK